MWYSVFIHFARCCPPERDARHEIRIRQRDLPAGTAPAGHSRIDRPKVKRNARPGAGLDPLLA